MSTPTSRVVDRLRGHYDRTVYDHKGWGSRATRTYAGRRITRPAKVPCDTVFQHVTVTRPSGDFKADCRAVESIGLERFGSGVSYNWLVDMTTGAIAVGQPLDAKGTHTVNNKGVGGYSYDQNYAARAIAVVGVETTPLSAAAAESIASILAAMVDEGIVREGFDYNPHSFLAYKDCPCDATRDRMPKIRDRCRELRAPAPGKAPAAPKPPTRVMRARDLLGQAIKTTTEAKRERRLRRALTELPRK